jgi:cytochrome P450
LFTPARVRALEGQARRISHELLDAMLEKQECDIVADFARPLASAMFLSLVDWPLSDRQKLEKLVELELNGIPGASNDEQARVKADAVAQMAAYCRERVLERRSNPDARSAVPRRLGHDSECALTKPRLPGSQCHRASHLPVAA